MLAESASRVTPVVIGFRVVRFQPYGLVAIGDGLPVPAEVTFRSTSVVVGSRVVRFQPYGFVVIGDGLPVLAEIVPRDASVVVGFRVVRFQPYGFVIIGDGFPVPAEITFRDASVIIKFRVVWFQPYGFVVIGDGLPILAEVSLREAPVIVGSRVVRFQSHGFVAIGYSLLVLAEITFRSTPVVVGFRVVRFQSHGFVVIGDGLPVLAEASLRNAPVDVGFRVVRFQPYGFVVIGDGLPVLAKAVPRDASVVVGFRVVRFQSYGFVVIGDGLPVLAEASLRNAPVDVGSRVVRLQPYGFVVIGNGLPVLAEIIPRGASVVVGFREIWSDLDGLVICRYCGVRRFFFSVFLIEIANRKPRPHRGLSIDFRSDVGYRAPHGDSSINVSSVLIHKGCRNSLVYCGGVWVVPDTPRGLFGLRRIIACGLSVHFFDRISVRFSLATGCSHIFQGALRLVPRTSCLSSYLIESPETEKTDYRGYNRQQGKKDANGGKPPIEGRCPVVEQLPPEFVEAALQRDRGAAFGPDEGRTRGTLLAGRRNLGCAWTRLDGRRSGHGQHNGGDGEDGGRRAPNPIGGHAANFSRASFRRDHGSELTP